jgi:predicted Zn-dependent protease with MMP-like domain
MSTTSTAVVVAVFVVLGLALAYAGLRALHPRGPVRLRSRHRSAHEALSGAVARRGTGVPMTAVDRDLTRRLRHLERSLDPGLSASQRHWFTGHLDGGRYAQAVESLAHWMVESPLPVDPMARDECLSIADALGVRGTVLGILHGHDRERHHRLHHEEDGRPGLDVPEEEFEGLVADAIDSLPEEFRRAMTNVVITVEEEAEGGNLYGLYVGVPLTRRTQGAWYANPDTIFIYRRTICAHCRTRQEVRDLVHKTVIHEIAHHFGISDPRLAELGWA